MARALFTPHATDFEWVDAIKRRGVAQGFDNPTPQQLTSAIRAVEHVLQHARGARG